jgi:hypothetical protein
MDNRSTSAPTLPATRPEAQKFAAKRSSIVLLIGFGGLALIALTRFGGAGGTISAKGIGPLAIGKATIPEMQRWARGPVNFWFRNKGGTPVHFEGKLWEYDCIGEGTTFGAPCRTLFGFRNGFLTSVETNDPRYFSDRGTHIGTPFEQTLERELGTWSGWSTACPHISLPAAKGVTYLATVSRNAGNPKGFITGFYLSEAPSSFRFCAS